MDVREAQTALAVLVACSSVAMEVVVAGSASPAAAEELSPTPAGREYADGGSRAGGGRPTGAVR